MNKQNKRTSFAIMGNQLFSSKQLTKPIYGDYSRPHSIKGNMVSAGSKDKGRADVNLRKF